MTRKPRTTGNGSGYHMTIKMMANDPTPYEIALRAAEIRAEWTADQESRRRGCRVTEEHSYTIPTVRTAYVPAHSRDFH